MIIVLLFVTVALVAAMVHAIVRDDRGLLAPPSSHAVDPAFLPPSSLLNRH